MFLKTYEGDAEDLCLTFSVTKEEFGKKTPIPLIPNGLEKDVTDLNKHRYIGLVAKHYVCDSVKEQSEAFRRGLWDVIDKNWLQIFNEPELQVVISGPTNGKIDVDDMKANTRLTGGYVSAKFNFKEFDVFFTEAHFFFFSCRQFSIQIFAGFGKYFHLLQTSNALTYYAL